MKSHASNLTELAVIIYKDMAAKCTTNQPDNRDVRTLMSRVEHEGLSFLTITLPSLGSDLDRSLALGRIAPNTFRSFKKVGTIPAFLQGMFAQVFDTGTGGLLDEPEVAAIEGIRQLAYAFKKLKLPCSPNRIRKSFQKFIEDEQDLSEPLAPGLRTFYDNLCDVLWDSLLRIDNSTMHSYLPKHGPGATAERISGNAKYRFRRWHDRLEPYFPLLEYAFSTEEAYDSEEFQQVSVISRDDEQPVRVITVPKTLKSPRIIAIEPVCMQYAQQALSRHLVSCLESHELTRGHVNFTDQTINKWHAMNSSRTGRMATLDLSSASDRVPLSLAARMFEKHPDFKDALLACRSERAQLPAGEVINLRKFASMGSALCFPVEAMYFYTICVGALLESRNLPVTYQNALTVSRDVYVYGDDIIVPADEVGSVMEHLQKYYCKVSPQKSYWTGKFRESCGTDAYNGYEVTPTYVRMTRPNDRRATSALISWIETSNQFYLKGYWLTSSYMLSACESILGELPIVGPGCAGLGKISYQHCVSIERWGRRYQQPEVSCWVATPIYRTDKLEGYAALLKSLLMLEARNGDEPSTQGDHLSRSARYGAVTLKRRWTRPF